MSVVEVWNHPFYEGNPLQHSWGECWELIFRSGYKGEGFTGPKRKEQQMCSFCADSLLLPCRDYLRSGACLPTILQTAHYTLYTVDTLCLCHFSSVTPSCSLFLSPFSLLRLLPLFLPFSPVSAGLCECGMWCHFSPGGPELCNWTAQLPDFISVKVKRGWPPRISSKNETGWDRDSPLQ